MVFAPKGPSWTFSCLSRAIITTFSQHQQRTDVKDPHSGQMAPHRKAVARWASLLLLLVCCAAEPADVLPSHAAVLQRVQFNPDNIVANVRGPECPVTNVLFDRQTEFDYTKAVQYRALVRAQNVSAQCVSSAASELAVCYTDGSYQIKYGCCSKACRLAFQKLIDSGCARELRLAACRDPRGGPLLLAGDVTLKRCLDYTEMNCKDLLAADAQGTLFDGLKQAAGSGQWSQSSSSATDRGGMHWRAAAAVLSAAVLAARL